MRRLALLFIGCSLSGCRCTDSAQPPDGAPAAASSEPLALPLPLPLPEAGPEPDAAPTHARCPEEMQLVPGSRPVCVDRWEAILVDKDSGERISPYYPVGRKLPLKLEEEWKQRRLTLGDEKAHALDVPPVPEWQRTHDPEPKAVSRAGQTPNGYLSGNVARVACANAGKRLCKREEWMHACRGAADRQFPYGDSYQQGACNVVRANHPAKILHDDASMGHLDPRLLLVSDKDGPYLRKTGTTDTCRSMWGEEALYDMVGNLDEWVDDPKGMFVGAFFSRGRKDGCSAVIKAHPNDYFDYSLGVRCCMDPWVP
jgi:formylglycine-generating enzyme